MGLIKRVKEDNGGNEISFYCSNCNNLLGMIYHPHHHHIILDFPNNCFNCNEKITQPVTTYEPIIDKVEFI